MSIALVLGSAVLCQAQPAGAASGLLSSVSFELGAASDADLSDDRSGRFSDIAVTHAAAAVTHRFPLREGSSLSFEGRVERFEFDVDPAVVPLPNRAHSLSAAVTLRQPLEGKWTFLGTSRATIANSGSGLDTSGFGVSLMAFGLYSQSDTLTWAVGLVYRSLTEKNYRLLPAVGFDWRPNTTWSVAIGFPRMGVTYQASDRLLLSLEATAQGGTFHVHERVGAGASGAPYLQDTPLDYTEVRVGAGLEYHPTPAVELFASAGAIVYQEFDYYKRDYDLDANGAVPFARIGARFLF